MNNVKEITLNESETIKFSDIIEFKHKFCSLPHEEENFPQDSSSQIRSRSHLSPRKIQLMEGIQVNYTM